MEDFNNYQQSGIISGLDNETVSALKSAQKNFNDDFMNGASTSGFRKYKDSKDENDLASTGENLQGILNGINSANQLIDSVITPKLTTYVTSYVTNIVMSYMTQATTEMLSFNLGVIASEAAKIMPAYLIGAGELMQELLKPRELMNDELVKDAEKEIVENINSMIGDTVGKMTDEVNKILDDINPTIAEIAYYSQMGPVWMQSKLDLAIGKIVEKSVSKIGTFRDTLIMKKEEAINNVAVGQAKGLADKANDKIKTQLKDNLDKLNKSKQDALNKVKTQLINVKLKLFALIGA